MHGKQGSTAAIFRGQIPDGRPGSRWPAGHRRTGQFSSVRDPPGLAGPSLVGQIQLATEIMPAMLASVFRLVSSRIQFVTFSLLLIAVIDLGRSQSIAPGPSGFTRIARDLGRK